MTNAEYVDGWELAFVNVHTQNYQGGDLSTVVYPYQHRQARGESSTSLNIPGPWEAFRKKIEVRKFFLATRAKLQFPFADQFTCQLCDVKSPYAPCAGGEANIACDSFMRNLGSILGSRVMVIGHFGAQKIFLNTTRFSATPGGTSQLPCSMNLGRTAIRLSQL